MKRSGGPSRPSGCCCGPSARDGSRCAGSWTCRYPTSPSPTSTTAPPSMSASSVAQSARSTHGSSGRRPPPERALPEPRRVVAILIAAGARRAPEQGHRREVREAELHFEPGSRLGNHARAQLELAHVHDDLLDLLDGEPPAAHQVAKALDRRVR